MARKPVTFRSILVPLDGSALAEAALPWAVELARAAQARLRLVLVHQMPPPAWDRESSRLYTRIDLGVRRSERDYLRRHATRVRRERGIRVATALIAGPVAPTLIEYVKESGADLVVMTTHGRGPLRRAWLGSVADQLLRTLEVPLLVIRPPEQPEEAPEPGAEEILVPLDGSKLAEAALVPATAFARLFGATIALLQVVAPVVPLAEPAVISAAAFDEGLTRSRQEQARDYLQGVAERLRGEGLRATAAAVLAGGAVECLLEQSRAPTVGLIALATHGRGGLRRLTMGSVADKLIRAAERPVLVVRPRLSGRR